MEKDPKPTPEGELVETGTFRVDRERMLKTLSGYQFPSPLYFIRAWARCAAASGASSLDLRPFSGPAGTGFELVFDGRPFTREELSDLYSPLMTGERGRGLFLATGLLALLKAEPASVFISSGSAAVEVSGLFAQKPADPLGGGGTVLRVLWQKEKPMELNFGILRSELSNNAGACPFAISCYQGGSVRTWEEEKGLSPSFRFDNKGRRGTASRVEQHVTPLTGFHPEQDSAVSVYVWGVYVETFSLRLPLAPVSIMLNDDSLTLDISMTKCVRNERFAALTEFAAGVAEDLILREIRLQKTALAEVGSRLDDPLFLKLWRARTKWIEAWTYATSPSPWRELLPRFILRRLPPPPAIPQDGLKFAVTGARAWWLQDACRRALKGQAAEPEAPLPRELWGAPVLLSTKGETLSLALIHSRLSGGRLAVSKKVSAENLPAPDAVWLASFRDERFLNEWIPKNRWDLV